MRDRSEKFIELAERRVNNTLHTLDLISNLSNRSNYEYTEEQVDKIMKEIDKGVLTLKAVYRQNVKRTKKFKL